ncbi:MULTISPECIES: hypothetical protein [Paenibacillus]|uniref:SH3b domain-containing protein n=1 Tax=Paenibacillus urinalis TaxID=521520 RepID=A0AAX3MWN9_9BACL|nr:MULTISPECIES: hypothetical protein [Paenibacillus]WDH82038.1 hypothetical protein PUW23_21595 [Paenibacillus urinalis]GAK42706.1 hypothetical protein TCA2_5198 [Paenibacillus sp. TCA20]SDX66382.1 hypothetical protein SAMN05518848_11138 [Paenibacillus sp. PDC88]
MKKMISITAALFVTASMAAAASAQEVTPTTETESPTPISVSVDGTSTTDGSVSDVVYGEPIVEPGDGIDIPLKPLEITKITYFYDAPNGKATGALSPQFVSVTGNEVMNQTTGETWVEIYTWKGIAWVNTGM